MYFDNNYIIIIIIIIIKIIRLNYLDAQMAEWSARQEYVDNFDLWWASKYISERIYLQECEEDKNGTQTYAEIKLDTDSLLWLQWSASELFIYWEAFNHQLEWNEFISIVRDHEWMHAYLAYKFPDFFCVELWEDCRENTDKIRHHIEEIICNSFQLYQAEKLWMQLSSHTEKSLKKEIHRDRMKCNKTFRRIHKNKYAIELMDILNKKHSHSKEIWQWT